MSRRSLRPQLNQIRTWVRQGRTDAWIAHQLEATVQQIQAFKREQGLEPDGDENGAVGEEVDLRAQDDEVIAAELEAEAARKAEEDARAAEEAARKAAEAEAESEAEGDEPDAEAKPRRRRSRGGRTRRRGNQPLEGTFDHGEEGYGLWLDPPGEDDPGDAPHPARPPPGGGTIEGGQNRVPPGRGPPDGGPARTP